MQFDFQDFQEKSRAIERKYAELRAASRKKHAAILKQRAEETAAREAAEEKKKLRFRGMIGSQPNQDTGFAQSMERLRQTFDKLESLLRSWAAQQSTVDSAKQIELPSSQSNSEDSPLDEPTSKEEIILSINDKQPEVEADGVVDNKSISHVVPQEKKPEDRTEQSIFEEEIGSHTDSEPQLCMMANHNFQVASFLMRDVYVDTGQTHGGQ